MLPAPVTEFCRAPMRMSTTTKLVVISVTAGVALLGVLARYLRRRKSPRPPRRTRRYTARRARNSVRSPNDIISLAGSKASARSGSPVGSTIYSDRMSMASGSVGAGALVASSGVPSQVIGNMTVQLSAQQLGTLGMEALDTVINHWEDALAAHLNHQPGSVPAALSSADESEFCREIQNLLEMAYTLQDQSELLFLDQRSVLFRDEPTLEELHESALAAIENGRDDERSSQRSIMSRTGSDPNFDSAESFASALDQVADLREFEEFIETEFEEYPLYQKALRQHQESPIPVRTLRTETVNCTNDTEYLVKLHCVRMAFQYLFKDPSIGQWICDTGRQILTDLLCLGDKDTKEFLVGYEDMVNFLHDPDNWDCMQRELEERGVKVMTFYDICLDFIILDSFRDLDAPPASVTAVVNNRFLSNGFKETALSTAVWSVLKAKKRMLRYQNGFMSHFYVISEQISPLMAWGFFGPDEHLRDVCFYFRDQLMCFLADIFNFQRSRYTTVEEFAEDVLKHMKTRVNNIGVKFSQ